MTERHLHLVVDHLETVRPIAVAVSRNLPRHVDLRDLVQEGVLGLIGSASSFDPERSVTFRQYSKARVKGAILDYLRGLDHLSRDARRDLKAINRTRLELLEQLGRDPDDLEICHRLGWPIEKFRAFQRMPTQRPLALLRNPDKYQDLNSEGTPLHIWDIPDERTIPADDLACHAEVVAELARAIERLPVRWRQLLVFYYRDGLTMGEIGCRLNVGEARISQIHAQCLSRLRESLESRGIQQSDAA